MPRANRIGDVSSQGGVFHLTHRCHNRAFLLKFKRDRDAYRSIIREHARQYNVCVLDYCITSNHVHLLVDAAERLEISGFMREIASEFARGYNRRKDRRNAFWGDNYHATVVEGGDYLWQCLCYIELNMVRCGVVPHPREWEWVGYQEIMGHKRRYRLLDLERLCWRLRTNSIEEVRQNLVASLAQRIASDEKGREACWTESLAVGSQEFVERIQPLIRSRRETEVVTTGSNVWALREPVTPYGQKTGSKIVAEAVN
jgi:putative transposase